jgi:putative membrane protein
VTATDAWLDRAAGGTIRGAALAVARRRLRLAVEGLEHVPRDGPVLLAVRHVHHLYDGVALLAVLERRLRILVALDWVQGRAMRALMEWATRTARWPALLRVEALTPGADGRPPNGGSAFHAGEATRFRLRAIREAVALLAAGEALAVFPEGYPNVDPRWTPKRTLDDRLPFRPGFAVVAALVRQRHGVDVPVVPVGLAYEPGERWAATVRFGTACRVGPDAEAAARRVEARVAALSRPA